MAGKHEYKGHCHCGAVRFTIALSNSLTAESLDERYEVVRCNCSVCFRNGYLLVYPLEPDLKFSQGKDKLGEYLFATKTRPHLFCKECGSSIGIDLRESSKAKGRDPRYAINARMLQGIDLDALSYDDLNGWDRMEPQYKVDN